MVRKLKMLVPNQMRYQAALLPDGGFPRGSLIRPQVAFGTKRNRTAQSGTLLATLSVTQLRPAGLASDEALQTSKEGSHG